MKAYLDGELAQEGQRKPVSRLFAVAGRSGREVLLNVVNTSPEPQPTAISFNGIRLRPQTAKAFVLRGDADEENTLELPDTLLPVAEEIRVPGPEWHHEFPPQSLTVLRLRL